MVEVDKETEEYNNAINEYKRLSNGYAPPKGLTTKQILALCEDMEAKAEALAEYVKIAGKDDIQDEEMTLEQIQNEIETVRAEKINTVVTLINGIGTVSLASESAIKTARANYDILSAELKSQVTNYSKLTSAESTLATLKQQKAAADAKAAQLEQQKATWAAKKAKVEELVKNFKSNLEDDGNYAKPRPWDTATLSALANFTNVEKVHANWYFTNTLKGANVGTNYGGGKKQVNFISACFPDGNILNRRSGKDYAIKVRDAYKSITSGRVNEYGVIV